MYGLQIGSGNGLPARAASLPHFGSPSGQFEVDSIPPVDGRARPCQHVVRDMGIAQCRLDDLVAHELLNDPKIYAHLDEAGGTGVTEGMKDELPSPERPIATLALFQA